MKNPKNEPAKSEQEKRVKTYRRWANIKTRCLNPKCPAYKNYGGRGIKVCERWMTFENFLEDVGDAPDGMSLDRINNDGDYCPDNVRWADTKTQNSNKRPSRRGPSIKLEFNGKRQSLAEWSTETGIPYPALCRRITAKWTVEQILTHPYEAKIYPNRRGKQRKQVSA